MNFPVPFTPKTSFDRILLNFADFFRIFQKSAGSLGHKLFGPADFFNTSPGMDATEERLSNALLTMIGGVRLAVSPTQVLAYWKLPRGGQ
jgi:hypothetical protein